MLYLSPLPEKKKKSELLFDLYPLRRKSTADVRRKSGFDDRVRIDTRLVCVTSAASYIGLAIVDRLVVRGYSVRALVDTQEDLELLTRVVESTEVVGVVVNLMDLESLTMAIDGCAAVFHTSGFVDPRGMCGYTKQMAELEATVAKNVVETCARTSSVRRCVLTSSLLACIWQRKNTFSRSNGNKSSNFNDNDSFLLLDESRWSDESLCRDRKLWFALGKTMMEKAALKTARGRNVEVLTICPGLITGQGFHKQCPSASIAYLKGGSEMYADGILATAEVNKVAEAHVVVYETADAGGRYVCYDRIVNTREEATELERLLDIPNRIISDNRTRERRDVADFGGNGRSETMKLSNWKLSMLMSRRIRCSFDVYYGWILD